MKLTKVLTLASIVSLVSAASAFAVTTINETTSTVGAPAMTIKVSKNVSIVYTPSTAEIPSGAGSVAYAITATHASGSKKFGSSSGDTKVYMQDGTTLTSVTSPEAAGSTADWSGWTAM